MLFSVRRLRPFQRVRGGLLLTVTVQLFRGASHAPTCTHGHSTLRAWRSDAMWRSSSDTIRPPELQIPIVCFLYIWQRWNSLFAPLKCNLTSLAVQWAGGQASERASQHGAVNLTADVQCGLLSRNQRCHFPSRKAKAKSHLFSPLRWLSEVSGQSRAEQRRHSATGVGGNAVSGFKTFPMQFGILLFWLCTILSFCLGIDWTTKHQNNIFHFDNDEQFISWLIWCSHLIFWSLASAEQTADGWRVNILEGGTWTLSWLVSECNLVSRRFG